VRWRDIVEDKPEKWTVTDSSAHDAKTVVLEREQVLAIIDKTIAMIDIAVSKRGVVVFHGD
jgi:hypothetical protein